MTGPYDDRAAAGRELADRLASYAGRDDVLLLALPRGGVPVAAPVAAALRAPLDVLVVRKLGLPSHPELAMGAIASVGGDVVTVRNEQVLARAAVPEHELAAVAARELVELQRREAAYRDGRPPAAVSGRVVVLVDDGLATGSTMRAAVQAVQQSAPARVVVAVPIGAPDTCTALAQEADEVVCAWSPERFCAVGQGYRDFRATSDHEVRALLSGSERTR